MLRRVKPSAILSTTLRANTRANIRFISASAPSELERDVVIVGGGPVGLTLASALASSKLVRERSRITLVEAGDLSKVADWTPPPHAYSNRASSITNSSKTFLEEIGAWQYVEQERTYPIEEMQVWDGISDARITFAAADVPFDSSGQIARMTENLNLQRGLLRHLSQLTEVELIDKVKVQSIVTEEHDGGWPLVHLSDGRVLRARLLVGADGPNSPVRAHARIQTYGWAYDTHGVVATLEHAPRTSFEGPNTTAYQRFLPTGPIAFLPLSETVSSLVWSTKPQFAATLKALDASVFAAFVNAAFRLPEVSVRYLYDVVLDAHSKGTPISLTRFQNELGFRERSHLINPRSALSSLNTSTGGIPSEDTGDYPPLITAAQPGTVASFPLRFSHADSYIGEGSGARTVLVGDAAHTIHPLAGQGLNLGLADVESLAKCIERSLSLGGDIGSFSSLMPYLRDRYFENHKILACCDKLHKLYATTTEPFVWGRSVGLEVLNETDVIKGALMLTVGSDATRHAPQQLGWELAAHGVETFAKTVDYARTFGNGAAGIFGGARQLWERASGAKATPQNRA